jgi:O-antigen/teichoic acid export membrane protein
MQTGEAPAFTLRSVRRRLLSGSAWVFGAKIGSLFVGIVVQHLIANLITPAQYGTYTKAFTLSLMGAAIAQLGLDRAVVRFVGGAIGTHEPGKARASIRMAVRYGGASAIVAGLILALGPGQLLARDVLHSPDLALVMPLVGGWLIATAVQSLFVESFRGMSRFAAATLFDQLFVDIASATAFAVVFAVLGPTTPGVVIGLAAGATGLAAAVAGVFLLRRVRQLGPVGEVSRGEMFHVAWPLMVTNVAILLLGSGIDVLILSAFRDSTTVGFYGAASRLVVFVVTPFAVFSGVIPPIIAELHAQGKMRALERALRAGATLAGLPALGVLLIFLFFGPFVLSHVYKPAYAQGATVLAILSLGRLYAVWAGSAGVTLMMTGNQRAMMILTLASGALSVVAGILGAYYFGAVGVATATAITQVIQNTFQLILVRRRLGIWTMIHFDPRELYRYLRPHGGVGAAEEAAEEAAEAIVLPDDEDVPEDPPTG